MSGSPPRLEIEIQDTGGPQALPHCPYEFPPAGNAGADGVIGAGGDFSPSTVVAAYRQGIFPWPHPEQEHLWFSPDPRAVIELEGLHVSRRLARTIAQGQFRVTMNAAFDEVVALCAEREDEGTWITPSYQDGYGALHLAGWAHSFMNATKSLRLRWIVGDSRRMTWACLCCSCSAYPARSVPKSAAVVARIFRSAGDSWPRCPRSAPLRCLRAA